MKSERSFYWLFGALVLLAASLPYLYGMFSTPVGHVYTGLTYNIDDIAVYFSWFRQAQSGEFFQRNLFNSEPQRGLQFSVLSLFIGNLARVTGLSLPIVFHLCRVLFGGLFLASVVGLLRETVSDERARRITFALVCTSAGFGWLTGGYDPAHGFAQPIDLWQPEAISFLSLYFAPLFTAALSLMVVFITALIRSERTGKLLDIWPAAVAGFLLANFHTYDVVHLFAVAFVFRIVSEIAGRRFDLSAWVRLIVAGLVTLPSLVYTFYALIQDPLFKQRDVKTLSESPIWTLLGLGLPLLLAVFMAVKPDLPRFRDAIAWRLLLVWSIVAFAVSYVPVDFQRKMLMGVHLPVAILAGIAITTLSGRLSGDFPKIAATFLIVIASVSNAIFLLRDVGRLSQNIGSTENRPYLTQNESDALKFLLEKTDRNGAVLAPPDPGSHLRFPGIPLKPYLAVYIPGWTGHAIYNGHWSETASYGRKWGQANRFFRQDSDDTLRREILREGNIRYVLYVNALGEGIPPLPDGTMIQGESGPYFPVDWRGNESPVYLKAIYKNTDITVYEVDHASLLP